MILTMTTSVTFDDVLQAERAIAAQLPSTPAWSYPGLDAAVGCSVVVKHENTQPTGAFKIRGGIALVDSMPSEELAHGLITASTGNHAQSVANAARLAGVPALIVMPIGSPAGKIAATQLLGAEVISHGPTMTEAGEHARRLAAERQMTYVDPGDTPAIIAGHATVYLELLRQHPELEAIYVPIGSGSGAAGACLVRDAIAPECLVVGVQSEAAPAAHRSWTSGRLEDAPCTTRHSGLATGRGFALPQSILRARLNDFLLVSDEQVDAAARLLARQAHTLAEGAGAAALAGLIKHQSHPARCAIICTGGNASDAELTALALPE